MTEMSPWIFQGLNFLNTVMPGLAMKDFGDSICFEALTFYVRNRLTYDSICAIICVLGEW